MKVLVAGIGNIFLGDDGFGVEVANRMAGLPLPPGVRVADFGIRGVHLAYELLDGYDALVLVDAVPMGEPPGTVALIEPELDRSSDAGHDDDDQDNDDQDNDTLTAPVMDAHSMNPAVVLGMLASLGGHVGRVLVVGCQPASLDEHIGLSEPVSAAVDKAVEAVLDALAELSASGATTIVDQSGVLSEERSHA